MVIILQTASLLCSLSQMQRVFCQFALSTLCLLFHFRSSSVIFSPLIDRLSFLFYCSAKTLPVIFDDSLAESIVPPRDQLATYDVPIFKYNDLSISVIYGSCFLQCGRY